MSAAGGSDEDQPVNYRRYVAAVLRHKWLLALLAILGLGAGIVLARYAPKQYIAQATIWIEIARRDSRTDRGPIQQEQLLDWSSWTDLLRSFVVLDEVVRRERLYLELRDRRDSTAFRGFHLKERFLPGAFELRVSDDGRSWVLLGRGVEIQRGSAGDSVGNSAGFEWVPPTSAFRPKRKLRFRVRTPREAALRLNAAVRTRLPQQGTFMRLELVNADPVVAAQTVNAIADRYVEVAASLKRDKLGELTRILREQLASSYGDLRRAETDLENFRVRTITLPSDQSAPVAAGLEQTRDPVFRQYFDLRVTRDGLQQDRQALDRVLAQSGDSGASAMALEAIPSAREAADLTQALADLRNKEAEARALRQQFTSEHPPLQRLESEIAELRRQALPALTRQLQSQLLARERELDTRIGSAGRELQQIPPRVIEEARLQRDVAIASNLYTTLQQRYEEARLAEVSSIPDLRILDRATAPEKPLANRAIMLIVGGLLGGLGAGVGLAILLDRFDRRVRYMEQISFEMGLPILGAVPRLKRGTGKKSDDTAMVVEALRTIRLNLVHAFGTAGPLVTVVTSPGPGDGKSFVASNLALSFADAGHRVLLVDADIRRGALHRVMSAHRKPGLIDFLSGQAAKEQVVQTTAVQGVDFIGCGTRRLAGPELLASPAMSQLLIGLRTQYAVILLDCAPLGAGVDPLVLGSMTGSLMLVLRTGVTDRELAMAKLEAVSRLPIRVLGAVMNDVRPEGAYRSQYYSYGYLSGYEAAEEAVK
jgi:tyrosine-protein kinase Etk/Wzc